MEALVSGVVEAVHVSAAFGGHEVIHCVGACTNALLSNALVAMGDRKRRLSKRRKRVFTIVFSRKGGGLFISFENSFPLVVYIYVAMNYRIICSPV